MDYDEQTIVQGYYTDIEIPLYEFVTWYTQTDQIMPHHDWHLICYVGYYRPSEQVLHATDWREFIIRAGSPPGFPWWILILVAGTIVVMSAEK